MENRRRIVVWCRRSEEIVFCSASVVISMLVVAFVVLAPTSVMTSWSFFSYPANMVPDACSGTSENGDLRITFYTICNLIPATLCR